MALPTMRNSILGVLFVLLCFSLNDSAQSPIKSLGYVLQADSLGKSKEAAVQTLAQSDRDLIVIDASYEIDTNQRTENRWSKDELDAIRAGKEGRQVVCYLSIGEAEDYRLYWKSAWDANNDGVPDAGAPRFLHGENPDWEGNYKVKYWLPQWQNIIQAEIQQIVRQGFDGVYLDIIDAFEFFEYDPASGQWVDDRMNPETGNTFRDDMVRWVATVRETLNIDGNSRLVIPQNGDALIGSKGYLSVIDAIAVEDVFTNGRKPQKKSQIEYRMSFLKQALDANKPVYVVEYPKSEGIKAAAIDQAKSAGFSLLMTDRQLKTLGESANP